MLLQRAGTGTIPPPGFAPPPWSSLALNWDSDPKLESMTVTLGPATVSIGHDDIEADDVVLEKSLDVVDHEFGWDNESPKRDVQVGEFRIEWRPITNGEFYRFYKTQSNKVPLPATWVEQDGEMKVCTFPTSPFVWPYS
jgi:formylglycine-generating enzyme required for sulfatase activity